VRIVQSLENPTWRRVSFSVNGGPNDETGAL
jgi:hypothetical protein